MAKREERFLADFTFFSNYSPDLPGFVYFLAGVCRARSDSPLNQIMSTLFSLNLAAEEGRVSVAHRKLMEGKVYNGKDEEVRALLARVPKEGVWDRGQKGGKGGRERGAGDCKICMQGEEENALEPLNNCGHAFHPSCLQDYFESEIHSNHIPVQCPLSTCRAEVAPGDVRLRVEEGQFGRYLGLSLSYFVSRNPERIRTCPTPDCQYAFEYNGETDFRCESCRMRYCLKCMTAYHHGMTCDEYRQSKNGQYLDQEFDKFVRGQNFKQCSNCKFWVERTVGCDHMTCRCGHHFCYRCGGPYRACHCVRS